MKQAWEALREERAERRVMDAQRYLAKAFELAADGDFEAAKRFYGYAEHQLKPLFIIRKGFKVEAK